MNRMNVHSGEQGIIQPTIAKMQKLNRKKWDRLKINSKVAYLNSNMSVTTSSINELNFALIGQVLPETFILNDLKIWCI